MPSRFLTVAAVATAVAVTSSTASGEHNLKGSANVAVEKEPFTVELDTAQLNATFPTDFYGVDTSAGYSSKSSWDCLKAANLKFAIIRCYRSLGSPDPVCAETAAAANAAGLDVHAYMFPCPTCSTSASSQVAQLLGYFNEHTVNVKRVWLDIEGPQYWHSSASLNQAFYEGLVNAFKHDGLKIGVYSSASQWDPIFGSGYSYGSELPLWYADYDGSPDFDDFRSFGGWTKPHMKQFTDQGAKCGMSYDISWGPSLPE